MPLNADRRTLLNDLLPEGMVVSRKWLLKNGMDRHAIDNLVKTDQLEALVSGIYKRPSSIITWQGLISSFQQLFLKDIVVGGITALELEGLGHYLNMSPQIQVNLYSDKPLSKWINNLIPVEFVQHASKFHFGTISNKDHLTANENYTQAHNWAEGRFPLIISIPERAVLEVLEDVPEKTSFEHAEQLMQGMTTLSPRKMQELLKISESIKVKRLFFWFAERQNYPWLEKIERQKINLGVGKRVVAKAGKLDKKYLITVPREYE